jgi:hypothetical protein
VTAALVLSGGPGHDFDATTAALVELLVEGGMEATVVHEPAEVVAALGGADRGHRPGWDLLVVNALRWRMDVARYAHLRDELAVTLTDDDAAALAAHVHGGGGLLALHAAVICFDAHPVWRSLVGGAWDWDRSSHRPPGPVRVTPACAGGDHPVTAGAGPFEVEDELYRDLDLVEGVQPLLVGDDGGGPVPVVWAGGLGRGRVVTDVLGHGIASLTHPAHRAVLAAAIRWTRGGAP